jgi:hypothetical protein
VGFLVVLYERLSEEEAPIETNFGGRSVFWQVCL